MKKLSFPLYAPIALGYDHRRGLACRDRRMGQCKGDAMHYEIVHAFGAGVYCVFIALFLLADAVVAYLAPIAGRAE